jgi:hypothetical protein
MEIKMQIEIMKTLMAHAVGQFGLDRFYTAQFRVFGWYGSYTGGPIVDVYEDEDSTKLCTFWMADDVIQEKKFY